ncbi:MAG TPA: type I-U CRISPR-associated RAMP protein Csb1/Cas7u [Solirubrobacteraceae bacterium]|jgi:CRISPR-associated protein Csb1|nr:type I-U CRISPR-associated RAMP protein Csb1/Cas7u [Solirubrobacteraceae bacterium]
MATKAASASKQTASHLAAALGGEGPDNARWASALRLRCRLQPAGGPGTKVMPPTYAPERQGEPPQYVRERRRIGDEDHECVLLDGIASQANRIEAALAARVRAGEIPLPTIEVDQEEFGRHAGLEFSHRCFDAWIEDARLDGRRFGDTEIYKQLGASISRHDLSTLMQVFPVGILLGCWASRSKNPQGTTRLARILSSELLAVAAVEGRRPASRIDIHNVSAAIALYKPRDGDERFTLDETRAAEEKGKPKLFRSGEGTSKAGKPSSAGYSNVTPTVTPSSTGEGHGGITMSYALQIATVSLPALRECGFPSEDGAREHDRDVAGRTLLATLALRMLALQVEHGYDLRSGCLLVPEEEPRIELIGRLGKVEAAWPVVELSSEELLREAIDQGRGHGLSWEGQTIDLLASEAQMALLRRSLARGEANAD